VPHQCSMDSARWRGYRRAVRRNCLRQRVNIDMNTFGAPDSHVKDRWWNRRPGILEFQTCGSVGVSGHRQSQIYSVRLTYTLLFLCLFMLGVVFSVQPTLAQSAKEKGLRIAQAAYDVESGFGDSTAEMSMILRNKRGQESRRTIRIKTLEVPDGGNKTLFVFDNPRDVKGTAFLTHGHKTKPDDQWIYLPALKRVKRISSSKRSGSFMGSEFSYEDLSTPEIEKYQYEWIRDEPCGILSCTVTEWIPLESGSGYSRLLVWHDRNEILPRKTEYYDRRNAHLKTLTHEDYNQYLEKHWRPGKLNMINHVTGKSTELNWENYSFNTGLDDRDFSQTGLRRVR